MIFQKDRIRIQIKSLNKIKVFKLGCQKHLTKKTYQLQVMHKNKMNTYYVKCRKDTENIDPKIVRTKNNKLVMQSKCSVCGIKESRFVKEQEAKDLLVIQELKHL